VNNTKGTDGIASYATVTNNEWFDPNVFKAIANCILKKRKNTLTDGTENKHNKKLGSVEGQRLLPRQYIFMSDHAKTQILKRAQCSFSYFLFFFFFPDFLYLV
jgi:hypothetical protein